MDRDSPVEMYANSWCPYCATARALLGSKGVQVTEIDIEALPERREEMIARSGRRTVPQIFIGPTHVGGYDGDCPKNTVQSELCNKKCCPGVPMFFS